MRTELRDKTLELLQNRNVTLTLLDISVATKISLHWIHKFSTNKIADPSVNRIQTLYEYLSKKELKF